MNKTTDKQIEALKLALEALEIGHEYAVETAEHFHIEMAGYKQHRHDAMDAEVKQIADAITTIRKALAEQPAQQGCMRCNTPKKCDLYGCSPLTWPAEQPAQQQGWKLVPVQPTDEMRDAGNAIIGDRGALFAAYRAMLNAAPQPAQQEPVAWMWRCKPYCGWPEWSVSLKRPADSGRDGHKRTEGYEDVPLYISPPAIKPWVNLTDEDTYEATGTASTDLLALAKMWSDNKIHVYQFDNEARKIIEAVLRRASAKLREKNTGETK